MPQDITSHQFIDASGNPTGGQTFGPGLCIAWQNGPLSVDGKRVEPNGCFVETVIAAAIDRLEFYQRSKFACEFNAAALEDLRNAMCHLEARTKDRDARGVEGTYQN